MKKIYVDPPEGHKYGFPKFYLEEEKPENFNKWLTDNGYPAQLIIDYGDEFHVRTWEEKEIPVNERIFNEFFDTEARFVALSRQKSYIDNHQLNFFVPPANDMWTNEVLKRALYVQSKYKNSYLTINKPGFITLNVYHYM